MIQVWKDAAVYVIAQVEADNPAQGGEILVSSLLKEPMDGAGDIRIGEGQELELKGMAEPNRVYAVDWQKPQLSITKGSPPRPKSHYLKHAPLGLRKSQPGGGDRLADLNLAKDP